MDEATRRNDHWTAALRPGSHAFPGTLLLALPAVAIAVTLVPWAYYLFGSGSFAPLMVALLIFLVLLAFKKLLFKTIYSDTPGNSDAALLEYLQTTAAGNGEEEVSAELLENALQLKQIRAHECMAPRPEIVHIDVTAPVEALRLLFVESRLSRILVTEGGDLDKVAGYVHVQQLFGHPASVREIVMPISFVPESIQVNDLLYKFIRSRSSIAGVVDEYGSMTGLITMEDALEQLFGQIEDEHDQEEYIEAQVSEQEFIFSGRLNIQHLNEKYPALELPEGDYNTLSGYLVDVIQTIPEQGERLEIDGKTFVLELVSDRKIETVRVLLS
jgi:putative hemolysin